MRYSLYIYWHFHPDIPNFPKAAKNDGHWFLNILLWFPANYHQHDSNVIIKTGCSYKIRDDTEF